jgi:hypothetical protein
MKYKTERDNFHLFSASLSPYLLPVPCPLSFGLVSFVSMMSADHEQHWRRTSFSRWWTTVLNRVFCVDGVRRLYKDTWVRIGGGGRTIKPHHPTKGE